MPSGSPSRSAITASATGRSPNIASWSSASVATTLSAARGSGVGKALLSHLAAIAVDRGCSRFEWAVLNWNQKAIDFYKAMGAEPMDEWIVNRVSGDALTRLAGRD